VTPTLIAVIIIASLYGLASKGITYTAWIEEKAETVETKYPDWGVALCFILVVASVVFIPITALLVHFDLFSLPGSSEEEKEGEKLKIPKSISKAALTDYAA